jgi:ABC-type sugar transport system permease subunit
MSFVEAIRAVFGDFFGFYGRAKRSEFWWWMFFRALVAAGAVAVIAFLKRFEGSYITEFLEYVAAAVPIVLVIPDLTVTVRRLHDVGASGKWVFVPILSAAILVFPTVASVVLRVFDIHDLPTYAWVPMLITVAKYVGLASWLAIFVLMFFPSRPTANAHNAHAPQQVVDFTNAYGLILPFLFLLIVFNVLVYARGFHLSLTDTQGINEGDFIGLKNYVRVFTDPLVWPDFKRSVLVTLAYTFGCLITQVPAAFVVAYILNTIPFLRIRAVLRAAFFLPCLINTVVIALLFRMMFNADQGIVNHVIGWLGFHGAARTDWLMHSQYAIPLLIIVSFWQWTGFHMVYFLAQLQTVDPTLYEAAKMDGVTPIGQLRHITLPLMRPAITFVAVTSAIGGLQAFDLVFMLFPNANFGPGGVAKTMVAEIYDVGFGQNQELGLASAIGFLTFFIIAGVSALQFRFLGLGRHGEA